MKVLSSVLLLAACVLTAYAVPKMQPRILVVSSSETGSAESGSLAGAEAACANQYNTAQQSTNVEISFQTNACLQITVQQTDPNSPAINAQVAIIRANLTSLQNNLESCTEITDNGSFVTCVANDNDVNQHLWSNAASIAQNLQGQLSNTQQQTQGDQKNCISHVLGNAKQNLTNAANQYNKCLEKALENPNLQ